MNDQPLVRRGARVVVTLVALLPLLAPRVSRADAAADGGASGAWPPVPRRLPPTQGAVELPAAERKQLEDSLTVLQTRIQRAQQKGVAHNELLPDVQIYEKAIRYALRFNEFWKADQAKVAAAALKAANERLDALEAGKHPWTEQRGAFVLGYTSVIDGSPQPYGVEIPEKLDLSKPVRLYVWLHGRGEQETDLYFINNRTGHGGQIKPTDGIVIHPFGRQCIGFKSAGEQDVFDAIEDVQGRFNIDPNRVALMGFSMGGAGAWHVGAHFAYHFTTVHAGAGFVDVVKFLHMKESDYPPPVTQTLWGVHDVPDYVRNLFNIPVITYGGEIDAQRAAGEIMVEAYKAEGRELPMIVGPKMPHRYDEQSLAKVMAFVKAALDKGTDPYPKKVSLQTRTLRYPRNFWVVARGLEEHWKDSRIDAERLSANQINVTTKNVNRLGINPASASGAAPVDVTVTIDGTAVAVAASSYAKGTAVEFEKTGRGWKQVIPAFSDTDLRKRPALQGPIDDVVMGPFLVVTPSGKCASPQVQKWVDFELAHFKERWPAVFRGDLRIKADTEVTPGDISSSNLILWGDAKSNKVIADVLGKLPIRWSGEGLTVAAKKYDAATHVPLMIYPNPLSPDRYVALNSGPTFREQDDANNSQQNPKWGDWAVVDVTERPDTKTPGKVVEAGFFDERWQFKTAK